MSKIPLYDKFEDEELEHESKCDIYFSLNPKINGDCKCGGKYILRQNHKNKEYFYGCTNYPRCTNTYEILTEYEYLTSDVGYLKGRTKDGEYILDKDIQYQEYLAEKDKKKLEAKIRREQKKTIQSKQIQLRSPVDPGDPGGTTIDEYGLPI